MKKILLNLFTKFLKHDSIQSTLTDIVNNNTQQIYTGPNLPNPYYDISGPLEEKTDKQPIFITRRFRSGSTLLWNVFRQIENCTSYYEPFKKLRALTPLT